MSTRTVEQQDLHRLLVKGTIAKRGVTLTENQLSKLEVACWKAIDENEPLSVSNYLIATNVYLNFILDFPDLEL